MMSRIIAADRLAPFLVVLAAVSSTHAGPSAFVFYDTLEGNPTNTANAGTTFAQEVTSTGDFVTVAVRLTAPENMIFTSFETVLGIGGFTLADVEEYNVNIYSSFETLMTQIENAETLMGDLFHRSTPVVADDYPFWGIGVGPSDQFLVTTDDIGVGLLEGEEIWLTMDWVAPGDLDEVGVGIPISRISDEPWRQATMLIPGEDHFQLVPTLALTARGEPACPFDIVPNGQVDAADLALLLGAWGPNPGHPADFNADGFVNAADLAQLLGNWGECP